MNLRTLAFVAIVCLPIASATNIPFNPPNGWDVTNVEGATYTDGALLRDGPGVAWVNLTQGNQSMLVPVQFPVGPVPHPAMKDYTGNLTQIRGLLFGLGDILQDLDIPEAYNDTDLLELVKSIEYTNKERSEDQDAVLAAVNAQEPPSLGFLYALNVLVLIALGFIIVKPYIHGKPPAITQPGTPARVVMEDPGASSD